MTKTRISEYTITMPMDLCFDSFFNSLSDQNKIYVYLRCAEWVSNNMALFFPAKEQERERNEE